MLAHGCTTQWAAALREVRALEAAVGADAADLALKVAAKRRLDAALQPLRLLAHAWSGAVMLAARDWMTSGWRWRVRWRRPEHGRRR